MKPKPGVISGILAFSDVMVPVFLVFFAGQADSDIQQPRNSDLRQPRSNSRGTPIRPVLAALSFSPGCGRPMSKKSRVIAALIVLLARFATAAAARTKAGLTKPN